MAFERFLERFFQNQQDWVLKSGYALEVRLQNRARSTVDLDLNATAQPDLLGTLQQAVLTPAGAYFEFVVRAQGTGPPEGGQRFHVEARLAGRPFARFHVDMGLGDVLTAEPEWLEGQVDLGFAEVSRTRLRVYPLAAHFAEKVHAFTRLRERQTRVKDLVDLALLLTLDLKPNQDVSLALQTTFERYATHHLPLDWPAAPAVWAGTFREMALQTGLDSPEMSVWEQRLKDFWHRIPLWSEPTAVC